MATSIQSRRRSRAAGFILMAAGVIGIIVGLAILFNPSVLGLSELIGALLGAVFIVFAAIEFVGGIRAYQGQNFYGTVAASVLGLLTVVTIPLNLVAAILVILGEEEFET